jgi:Domain of unknown function (DUF4252)
MSGVQSFVVRRAGTIGAVAAVVFYVAVNAHAQPAATDEERAPGRIDLDAAELPAAAIEIDLSQGMFRDLLGLGDAAIAGMAESMLQSADDGKGGNGTRMAAEQLAAVRQVIQLASEVVHEARVRVYREMPAEGGEPEAVAALFDDQLRAGSWDNAVRAREKNQSVRVSLLREEGAVRGIFIVAGQGSELVLVNVVCDISPANIKKLTAAATKIGLDNGLAPMIEMKMRELHRAAPPAPPRPPQPELPEDV